MKNKSLIDNAVETMKVYKDVLKGVGTAAQVRNLKHFNRDLCVEEIISHVPPVFIASISEQCNLRCPNCLFLLVDEKRFFNRFMTPAQLRELMNKYNSRRLMTTLMLTGGEPLMNPDIREIVEVGLEFGCVVRMSTNGILAGKHVETLKLMDSMNVSVDAHDYESYKTFRGGTRKQFDTVMENVRALREAGINFNTSFVMCRENIAHVEKMFELAAGANSPIVYFHNINPHGTDKFHSLTMQDPETVKFIEKIMSKTDYPFDIKMPVIFDADTELFREKRCPQPWEYFTVSATGDMAFCCHLSHDASIGNAFGDYDFNSEKMTAFRKRQIESRYPADCKFCQRRFIGMEYARFDSKLKLWKK